MCPTPQSIDRITHYIPHRQIYLVWQGFFCCSKGWDREHFRSALRQLLNLPSDVARPIHRLNDQMQEKQIPTE